MGQASWAKMTSPGGKLTALVCHLTKDANKAKELAYLSPNIVVILYLKIFLIRYVACLFIVK
jgi:hypothetical protein